MQNDFNREYRKKEVRLLRQLEAGGKATLSWQIDGKVIS